MLELPKKEVTFMSQIDPEKSEVVFFEIPGYENTPENYWIEKMEKAKELKRAQNATLLIVATPIPKDVLSKWKQNQVKPEDVFKGHSEKNVQWISLPEVWRDSEKNLRKSKSPYKKTILRADQSGNVKILEIYCNTFENESNVVLLRDLSSLEINLSKKFVYNYLELLDEEESRSQIEFQTKRISKKAISYQRAEMKTIYIETNLNLSDEQKSYILDNRIGKDIIASGNENKKENLISIPRSYLQEELTLRKEKIPYVKIFKHFSADGKVSFVYQVETWNEEGTVIVKETYNHSHEQQIYLFKKAYKDYLES